MSRLAVRPAAAPSRAIPALLGYLAVAAGLAVLGASTTIGAAGAALERGPRVPWQPPIATVVAIWTVLFATQAVAAWLVHRRGHDVPTGPSLPLW
jgi:tryptophan-rich sensory protein